MNMRSHSCHVCRGGGLLASGECPRCLGSGFTLGSRNIRRSHTPVPLDELSAPQRNWREIQRIAIRRELRGSELREAA